MKTTFLFLSVEMVIEILSALLWTNKHLNDKGKYSFLKLNLVWGFTITGIWVWAIIGLILGIK